MQGLIRRRIAALALAMLLPLCAAAQRHGRPDAVQNYMKSSRPSNPQLALKFEASHKWTYFHLTELRQMKRTTVSVIDPITHAATSYEGVRLSDLVPDGVASYRFEVFKQSWGFRDKRVMSSDDLNMESDTIVADTINGRKLVGDNPFCFAATAKRGGMVVVKKLAHIKVVAIPATSTKQ
jgi:hypothetical protein